MLNSDLSYSGVPHWVVTTVDSHTEMMKAKLYARMVDIANALPPS